MDETFHPSTLSEILDRTAQLYRARFLVFLGIAFIPVASMLVPIVAVFVFFAWTRTHPSDVAVGVVGVLGDRKSTRLNSSHLRRSRMPSSA